MPWVRSSSEASRSLASAQMRGAVDSSSSVVDPEIARQLEVGPVVERVAQAARDGCRPGQELLVGVGVAGAEALVDPVGAHRPPLVVVALEPDLEQVREPAVLGDVLRRQVAVVIEDRLVRGVGFVEPARGCVVQKELRVDERHDADLRCGG